MFVCKAVVSVNAMHTQKVSTFLQLSHALQLSLPNKTDTKTISFLPDIYINRFGMFFETTYLLIVKCKTNLLKPIMY
jgi:hypothetical protein